MSLQDKNNISNNTITVVNNFVEANQRKRKNLLKELESSIDQIYLVAEDLFDDFGRNSNDWAVGWILQLLKKYKPEFFENEKYNCLVS